jgi:hypothetical protein
MDQRLRQLDRDLRLIRRYAVTATLLLGALSVVAFRQAGQTRFTEIDVERLNVVEKNGTLRLAIANRDRYSPIIFYGKAYPGLRGGSSPGMAGMTFFNEEGTENGGFGWRGRSTEGGGHSAAASLTFDQFNQDETLALMYNDQSGRRSVGFLVFDEPNASIQPVFDSLMAVNALPDGPEKTRRLEQVREWRRNLPERRATRLFAGKDPTKATMVLLADPQGRPRLRMSVDSLGASKIEFLDEGGKVTYAVPGSAR